MPHTSWRPIGPAAASTTRIIATRAGASEVDNGRMDGFMKTSTAEPYAIGYYQEADNQFLSKVRP